VTRSSIADWHWNTSFIRVTATSSVLYFVRASSGVARIWYGGTKLRKNSLRVRRKNMKFTWLFIAAIRKIRYTVFNWTGKHMGSNVGVESKGWGGARAPVPHSWRRQRAQVASDSRLPDLIAMAADTFLFCSELQLHSKFVDILVSGTIKIYKITTDDRNDRIGSRRLTRNTKRSAILSTMYIRSVQFIIQKFCQFCRCLHFCLFWQSCFFFYFAKVISFLFAYSSTLLLHVCSYVANEFVNYFR